MGKAELHIDADLLARARAAGLPAEEVVETALRQALSAASGDDAARHWAQENAEALDERAARVSSRGVFSDGVRTW